MVHAALIATMSGHTSWVRPSISLSRDFNFKMAFQVLCVAFSPDNDHFVSGSSDGSVKVKPFKSHLETVPVDQSGLKIG